VNKINELNISEINNNRMLNINQNLNKMEIIKDTLVSGPNKLTELRKVYINNKKDEYVNILNLLNEN
jgi:hypothetical protein